MNLLTLKLVRYKSRLYFCGYTTWVINILKPYSIYIYEYGYTIRTLVTYSLNRNKNYVLVIILIATIV